MDLYNLVSLSGLFLFLLLSWVISENRKNVNFRTVLSGIGLMFIFAIFIFLVPFGPKVFLFLNNVFLVFLNASGAGAEFLFGPLALPPGAADAGGSKSIGFILAFQVFPVIIFFSAIMSVLYYYGIMQKVIKAFSIIFTKFMKTSGAESLVVASNIFVGIESAFTVRPYINNMTRSELCMILTAGMATVSSSVMGLYVFILQGEFPTIAAHLISASLLSAPAAIVISKILVPETEKAETAGLNVEPAYDRESGVIEAVIKGSESGVRMIVGIAALLVAVLGIVKLFDLGTVNIGHYINLFLDINIDWSLKSLLGYVFYPFTLMIGIPLDDALKISGVIGERLVVTEVVSYQDLAKLIKDGQITNHRTIVVTSYALCGFAHFASMAIFVGGISALAPKRTSDIAKLGIKALIAATMACMITACIAGMFYTPDFSLFSGG